MTRKNKNLILVMTCLIIFLCGCAKPVIQAPSPEPKPDTSTPVPFEPIKDRSKTSDDSSQNYGEKGEPGKIVISLPYSSSQPTISIVPMGETMFHPDPPNPGGHPGIDFQWDLSKPISIIACADGDVISAKVTPSHNKWDVYIKTGSYTIAYTELENIEDAIRAGARVKLGQRIGEPGKFNGNHYNIHWVLKYGTNVLCPLSFFDPDSKRRIEEAWAKTKWPELKANAPDICWGKYKEK